MKKEMPVQVSPSYFDAEISHMDRLLPILFLSCPFAS